MAYQVSSGGTEESVLHVLDVATGELVDGPIDRARYSPVAWLPGGEAFYYVRRLPPEELPEDEAQYHRRIWLHRLGTPATDDVEVFGAGLDHTNYYGVSVSRDGRWLIVSASAGTAPRTDVWIADLAASGLEAPSFVEVAVGLDAETGAWVARDGRLYVHTDLDAPRGRIAVTDPTAPGVEHWTTLLAEDPTAVLEDVAFIDGGGADTTPTLLLASVAPARGVRGQRARPAHGRAPTGSRSTCPGSARSPAWRRDPDGGPEVWFSYADHTTPTSVHRFDARTGDTTLWAAPPGLVADLPDVRAQQIEVTSPDGTTVRAFVVARTDALDASGRPLATAPTILYGYGGFQISLDPAFSATTLAWVEAGGVYVVANLRGGGEEGEEWHRAGMRAHKQNVFDDFHAVGDHLVAAGLDHPGAAGVLGRLQRRPAGGRRPDAAARPVRGRRLLRPAARHGPLPAVRPRRDVDRGVRRRRRPHRARLAARLLAVPPGASTAPTTPRPCSPCSRATPASTRCTPASSPRRCRRPPAATGPCWSGASAGSGTAAARCRRTDRPDGGAAAVRRGPHRSGRAAARDRATPDARPVVAEHPGPGRHPADARGGTGSSACRCGSSSSSRSAASCWSCCAAVIRTDHQPRRRRHAVPRPRDPAADR